MRASFEQRGYCERRHSVSIDVLTITSNARLGACRLVPGVPDITVSSHALQAYARSQLVAETRHNL